MTEQEYSLAISRWPCPSHTITKFCFILKETVLCRCNTLSDCLWDFIIWSAISMKYDNVIVWMFWYSLCTKTKWILKYTMVVIDNLWLYLLKAKIKNNFLFWIIYFLRGLCCENIVPISNIQIIIKSANLNFCMGAIPTRHGTVGRAR